MGISNIHSNVSFIERFRRFFANRDVILHDGRDFRRFRLAGRTQLLIAAAVVFALSFSFFGMASAANLLTSRNAHSQQSAQIAQMRSRFAAMQANVATMKRVAEARYRSTASHLERLGLSPKQIEPVGVGGPFEPADVVSKDALKNADAQFHSLFMAWKKLDGLEKAVISIPSREPVDDITRISSTFGVRTDPFNGRASFHPGIDLPGPVGTPIYATADGIVDRAEPAGGYGNMIEINHGRGIQTRYGHLSKILVDVNQRVHRGDLIGLMGSTGRSTGSHLHYEVRIDNEPVDPAPYIDNTDYFAKVQDRMASVQDADAIGGPAD